MNKKQEYTDTYIQFMKEAKDNSLVTTQLMTKLHYYETALSRLNETHCNREMTDHEEKRQESIRNKAKTIAGQLGFKLGINSDPRGGAIRFILPSGKSNNWDGETWGIYW